MSDRIMDMTVLFTGLYVLTNDIPNPKVDRRSNMWDRQPMFIAGVYEVKNNTARGFGISIRRITRSHSINSNASPEQYDVLAQHLVAKNKSDYTLAEILLTEAAQAEDVLAMLLDKGVVSKEHIILACHRLTEKSQMELVAFQKKHGI